MKELETFRGHQKELTKTCWHPVHEDLFVSASHDGTIIFWLTHQAAPASIIEQAHDAAIWTLDFHPVGHVLATGSNDNTTKFWIRHRPGDSHDPRFMLKEAFLNHFNPETLDPARLPKAKLDGGAVGDTSPQNSIPGLGGLDHVSLAKITAIRQRQEQESNAQKRMRFDDSAEQQRGNKRPRDETIQSDKTQNYRSYPPQDRRAHTGGRSPASMANYAGSGGSHYSQNVAPPFSGPQNFALNMHPGMNAPMQQYGQNLPMNVPSNVGGPVNLGIPQGVPGHPGMSGYGGPQMGYGQPFNPMYGLPHQGNGLGQWGGMY